jgi:hypothetical protein
VDKKNFLVIGTSFFVLFLSSVHSGNCRENVLYGALTLRQEYDSNIFEQDDNEVEQWTTILAPKLSLVSSGEKDAFSITVGSDLSGGWSDLEGGENGGGQAGFSWDQRLDERYFAPTLLVEGHRQISQNFRITVSDNYNYYDNAPRTDLDPNLSITERFQRAGRYEQAEVARVLFPELRYTPDDYLYVLTELARRFTQAGLTTQQEVERYLSNTEGRRRYSDNEFSIGAEYEFARDSLLTLGYRYFANDDRSASISEYYEHSPSVGLTYRFNPQWLAGVSHAFTKGQYDTANDLTENDTLFTVGYTVSPTDQLTASYGYDSTNFQGTSEDIVDQTGELGWDHDFNVNTRLNTTLSENYLTREFAGDENEFGLDVGVTRRLQRGSVSLGAGGSLGQQKRDATWEDLRRTWSVDGAITYALQENVTTTFDLAYEKRYLWPETGGKSDFDDYEAGVALTYSFMRWFALTCRYTFIRLESNDSIVSGYDEHLVMVELSAARELLRW